MSSDSPWRIVIMDFLPVGIFNDLKNRVNQTDWDGFFQSLFATGFVIGMFSAIGSTLLYILLGIILGDSGVFGSIFSAIVNIGLLATILYFPCIFLLNGVNQTVNSTTNVLNISQETDEKLSSIRRIPGFAMIRYIVNLILLGALLLSLYIIRYFLVARQLPNPDMWSVTFYIELSAALLVDLTYIGLVLMTISHWYVTVKTSP